MFLENNFILMRSYSKEYKKLQKLFPLNMHGRNADISLFHIHILITSMKFYTVRPLYNMPPYIKHRFGYNMVMF